MDAALEKTHKKGREGERALDKSEVVNRSYIKVKKKICAEH